MKTGIFLIVFSLLLTFGCIRDKNPVSLPPNDNKVKEISVPWEKTNGPFGADVRDFAVNSQGEIFAATSDGLFYSNNNGNSWAARHITTQGVIQTDVRSLAINAQGQIFAGLGRGVFCSYDNGLTWQSVGLQYGASIIDDLLITSQGYIFAATIDLYRSKDNGATWEKLDIGMPQYAEARHLAVHPAGDIFVGTTAGLFKSSDNGENWEQVDGDIGDGGVLALAINSSGSIFVSANLNLYRSDDNAQNLDIFDW